VRQLAFAGIAVIWIFKVPTENSAKVPGALVLPGLLLIGALAFDLLHYAVGTAIYGIANRGAHGRGIEEGQTMPTNSLWNLPTLVFFWGKILLVAAGYVLILAYLWHAVRGA
jgi:hypothetical protein